jgi:hypothetical protein
MEILQLPALKSLLLGEYPTTELLSTVKSTIATSLLSLPCRARLNCQPSNNWVPGWRPFHTNLLVFSSQADLTTELSHSPNTYFTHFTQLNCPACLGSTLRSLMADPTENTLVSSVTVLLCASRFRGKVFTEPLPRNACSSSQSLHSNGTARYNILSNLSVKSIFYGRQVRSVFIFTFQARENIYNRIGNELLKRN